MVGEGKRAPSPRWPRNAAAVRRSRGGQARIPGLEQAECGSDPVPPPFASSEAGLPRDRQGRFAAKKRPRGAPPGCRSSYRQPGRSAQIRPADGEGFREVRAKSRVLTMAAFRRERASASTPGRISGLNYGGSARPESLAGDSEQLPQAATMVLTPREDALHHPPTQRNSSPKSEHACACEMQLEEGAPWPLSTSHIWNFRLRRLPPGPGMGEGAADCRAQRATQGSCKPGAGNAAGCFTGKWRSEARGK